MTVLSICFEDHIFSAVEMAMIESNIIPIQEHITDTQSPNLSLMVDKETIGYHISTFPMQKGSYVAVKVMT